ncbi:MAG TPA: DinB family protein [Puia sp.]|nr:DinB family protein [Puia sp.]
MKQKLLTTLDVSQNYTLGVAQLMPEDGYAFSPAEGVWNFGELIHHIAYGIYWWEDNFLRKKKTEWNPPAAAATKKAAVQYLTQAFASLRKTVETAVTDDDTVYGFFATIDHITHHRGQATVYLRGRGIKPPEYAF